MYPLVVSTGLGHAAEDSVTHHCKHLELAGLLLLAVFRVLHVALQARLVLFPIAFLHEFLLVLIRQVSPGIAPVSHLPSLPCRTAPYNINE